MSWVRARIRELEHARKVNIAHIEKLILWRKIALSVLTDDQLDFQPFSGETLRQRLDKATKP